MIFLLDDDGLTNISRRLEDPNDGLSYVETVRSSAANREVIVLEDADWIYKIVTLNGEWCGGSQEQKA